MICEDTQTYGWMGGLMGGLMSNHLNQINFDLIEIIQLWTFWTFLDILLKPPQPLVGLFFIPRFKSYLLLQTANISGPLGTLGLFALLNSDDLESESDDERYKVTPRRGHVDKVNTCTLDEAAEDISTNGMELVDLKIDVIERGSTELETDPKKLLLYDPSQHFPRIEEVLVVQAPPPEPNGSQNATENGESNAEGLEDIPNENEQLYGVGPYEMLDKGHGSGEATKGLENDSDGAGCTQNAEGVAAEGEDEGLVADRCQQSREQVPARDAQEIENHDDTSGGPTTHSGYAGVVVDSGYESEIYERVTFSFMRATVMILGYNDAGKTCLSETLLGFPFRDPKNSSNVRESHCDELDDLSKCKVTGIHAHVAGQHWTQLDETYGEALKNDLGTRLTDAIATDNRRRAGRELTTRLKILDIDGEFPFYQTHPMLMSKSMVYLVVMDVTKKLDDVLPQSTLAKKWKGKIEYPNTPRKFLDHWLTSISTFLNEHGLPDQHRKNKSIVLVLTHTDKLDPSTKKDVIKKFKQEVLAHVKKQHAAKYVVKTVIAVSNTDRDICHEELRLLKDAVLELAESRPTFGVTTSCAWLKFEADIMEHCEVLNRKYLTVGEMGRLSGQVGMSREQVQEFLTFHKEIGSLHLIDHELDNLLVVTDPQFLVDAFMSIIDMWINRRTSQWSLTDEKTLDTDLDDGIFSLRNLGLIWKNLDETVVESLATILKSSRLFISWKHKDEQGNILPEKYIVPCLQPPMAESGDDVQEKAAPKTLVYFFHTAEEKRMVLNSGFLPRGFLFLLIASLMEEKENAGAWENTHLFCNGASFRTGTHGDIDLTMSTDASAIKLDVSTSRHPQSDSVCADISTARSTFEEEVKQLLQNQFPNVRCSVCISPCHTNKGINQSNYSCLNILGSLGHVGTKRLWSARCKTHRKEAALDTFKDWFHNELYQLVNENSAAKSDESLINNVTSHIPSFGTLKDIAIRLKIRGREVDQIISNCPNDIKAASLKVLYDRWCENTEGNLQKGSPKYEQLKRAFNEAGVHNVL